MKKIGFIGLGAMGSKIAQRLITAGGFNLTVFNRTPEKANELVVLGAVLAASPKVLAENSDVIMISVSDDVAVRAVVLGEAGAFVGACQGAVFIDCSTISVAATREFAAQAEKMGFAWLDAPVLGSPQMAIDGEMPFVVGGSEQVLEANKEILEVVGKKIVYMGGVGLGQAAKLVHNLVCGISLVAFSEALVLGEKLGLARKQTLEVLANGAVGSRLLTMKTPKFEEDLFEPTAAPLVNMRKDLTLATEAARMLNLTLPETSIARQLYDKAVEQGLSRQDTSSIIKALQ